MANMAEQLKQTSEKALKTILMDSALGVEKFYDKFLINELQRKAIKGERSFTFPQDLLYVKNRLKSVVESPSVGTYFEFTLDINCNYDTVILFRHLETKLKDEGFKTILNAEKTPYIQIMW